MNINVWALTIQLIVLCLMVPNADGGVVCESFWKFVCPSGITWLLKVPWIARIGRLGCKLVGEKVCDRNLEIGVDGQVDYAFPDEFDDYDQNKDGQMEYEEFTFTLMKIFPMQQPEEFRKPFEDADRNKNGRIEREEFKKAPFLVKHPSAAGVESLRVDDKETRMLERR